MAAGTTIAVSAVTGTKGHSGRPCSLAPAAVRLHHHLPLSLSPTDDGAGLVSGVLEMARAPYRRRALCHGGAVLGEDFRAELCRRRRDGHPHGVPVRDQLG